MSAAVYQLRSLVVDRERKTVLNIERIDISEGKVTCVIGPNGSGKSTLLQLLALLTRPSSGSISFQGAPVDFNSDLTDLRRRTTLVDQEPLVFHRSVRANLRYGLRQRGVAGGDDERIEKALSRVGLAGFASRPAMQLSGGERHRVAIARAIVLGTDVVLLDEPTASVDRDTRATIELIVSELASSGSSVILSTHDLEQARRVGDEVIALEGGEAVLPRLVPGSPDQKRQ